MNAMNSRTDNQPIGKKTINLVSSTIKKRVGIEFLDFLSLVIASLFWLAGYKVTARQQSPIAIKIQKIFHFGFVGQMDLGKSHLIDPALSDDYRGYGELVFKCLNGPDYTSIWSSMMLNIEKPSLKINVLLNNSIQRELAPLLQMLAWREDILLQESGNRVTLLLQNSYPKKILVSHLKVDAVFLPSLKLAARICVLLFNRFMKRADNSIPDVQDTGENHHVNIISEQDVSQYEALFFPHLSIGYGKNLYSKDHYYNFDRRSSPLHPSKVLHVELGKYYKDYFDSNQLGVESIDLHILRPGAKKTLTSALHIYARINYLLLCNKVFWRRPLNSIKLLRLVNMLFIGLTQYESYRLSCQRFKNAKVALVGYDILFPPPLSMALESLGIKTIAVQERLSSSYAKCFSMTFDTYMIPSEESLKVISGRSDWVIRSIVPVGLQRSDYLYAAQRSVPKGKELGGPKRVLVLDFHSEKDEHNSPLAILNSWPANLDFYNSIIALAKEFPDLKFTIRGKHIQWLDIPFFYDVKKEIISMSNIAISTDYKTPQLQYKLAAVSDMVVARHTSMVDECIVAGKPVVIVDYYPNAISYVDKLIDYSGFAFTALSREELSYWVAKVLIDGYRPVKLDNLHEVTQFFGPYDGCARERIRKEAASMLKLIN